MILYVDDILLATNSIALLKSTKEFLQNSFDMKDMGEAHYVLGIEIQRDRDRCVLGLSQKHYIEKVLHRFGMEKGRSGESPMSKGVSYTKTSVHRIVFKRKGIENIPYARLVGSLMHMFAQGLT